MPLAAGGRSNLVFSHLKKLIDCFIRAAQQRISRNNDQPDADRYLLKAHTFEFEQIQLALIPHLAAVAAQRTV